MRPKNYFGGSSKDFYRESYSQRDYAEKNVRMLLLSLGLDRNNKKLILVVEGGARSRSINNAMQYVERELSGRSDVQVLHATGEVNYEYYMAEMRKPDHWTITL